jgi:hypothetical protein
VQLPLSSIYENRKTWFINVSKEGDRRTVENPTQLAQGEDTVKNPTQLAQGEDSKP